MNRDHRVSKGNKPRPRKGKKKCKSAKKMAINPEKEIHVSESVDALDDVDVDLEELDTAVESIVHNYIPRDQLLTPEVGSSTTTTTPEPDVYVPPDTESDIPNSYFDDNYEPGNIDDPTNDDPSENDVYIPPDPVDADGDGNPDQIDTSQDTPYTDDAENTDADVVEKKTLYDTLKFWEK